jgi:hypothetical protein
MEAAMVDVAVSLKNPHLHDCILPKHSIQPLSGYFDISISEYDEKVDAIYLYKYNVIDSYTKFIFFVLYYQMATSAEEATEQLEACSIRNSYYLE